MLQRLTGVECTKCVLMMLGRFQRRFETVKLKCAKKIARVNGPVNKKFRYKGQAPPSFYTFVGVKFKFRRRGKLLIQGSPGQIYLKIS